MNQELIRWATQMSLLVAGGFGCCVFMLPNRRGPLALTMLLVAIVLVIGVVVRDQDGRSLTQHLLTQLVGGGYY